MNEVKMESSFSKMPEGFASPEKALPTPECLVILGGGIDQVTIRNTETGEERKKWNLAPYAVQIDPEIKGRDKRTGIRRPFTKDITKDTEFVVQGGTAHLLAGIQFLDEMRMRKFMPQHVVFAAGRPDFIQRVTNDLAADEGEVMRREFERRTKDKPFERKMIEVRGKGTKSTAGDLLNGLKATFDKGLKSAVIIVTEARMERTRATHQVLLDSFPKLNGIKTTFISAEDLLRRRFPKGSPQRRDFEEIQTILKNSPLWKETKEREDKGIRDLKKGNYDLQISGIDTTGLE